MKRTRDGRYFDDPDEVSDEVPPGGSVRVPLFCVDTVRLQQIPVKLTHSRHVESSCGILHEKASVRKHRRGGVEHEQSARKIFADRL
jgi:hypothetical protein